MALNEMLRVLTPKVSLCAAVIEAHVGIME